MPLPVRAGGRLSQLPVATFYADGLPLCEGKGNDTPPLGKDAAQGGCRNTHAGCGLRVVQALGIHKAQGLQLIKRKLHTFQFH